MVHRDHHIEVGRAWYSVPHAYTGQQVEVRLGQRVVEVFKDGVVIATHPRATQRHQRTTLDAHRPPAHQAYLARDLAALVVRARRIGPATAAVVAQQGQRKLHPVRAERAAQGILRLAEDFSAAALEQAAARALQLQTCSYRALRDLIRHAAAPDTPSSTAVRLHPNVRGSRYFH